MKFKLGERVFCLLEPEMTGTVEAIYGDDISYDVAWDPFEDRRHVISTVEQDDTIEYLDARDWYIETRELQPPREYVDLGCGRVVFF